MAKFLVIKGADFSAVSVAKVTPVTGKILISVVSSGNGSVSGSGSYDEGDSVTITATPSAGYKFVQWNDGNTNASRTIVVGSSNATYTATFAAIQSGEVLVPYKTVDGYIYYGNAGTLYAASGGHIFYYNVSPGSSYNIKVNQSGTGSSILGPTGVLIAAVDGDDAMTQSIKFAESGVATYDINQVIPAGVTMIAISAKGTASDLVVVKAM